MYGVPDGTEYKIASIDADVTNLDVLEQYKIGEARVYITRDGRYVVQEPGISDKAMEMYDIIMKKIVLGVGLDADDRDEGIIAAKLEESFWEAAKRLQRLDEARAMFPHLRYYIQRNLVGFGILDVLMRDPNIEDILCSAYGRNVRCIHKRYSGQFHTLETNITFDSITDMEQFIQRSYSKTGREPTESKPMSVSYLQDGSRISATFGRQVSKPGPVIAIRKFPAEPFTITHMLKTSTLTAEMAAYIWTLLDAKAVGLAIGVTGSGKTTLLSSFVSMMNPRWRILTIEDTLELQIPHTDWVRTNTRKSYGMMSSGFDITIRSLIDISLTQKPDYEIVGEIRLDDMDALFQSVGTGHGGLTSFHASTPEGALTRMRGNKIGEGELALIWFVVHSSTVRRDGINTRKVMDISEIVPDETTGHVETKNIYRYDIFTDRFIASDDLYKTPRYIEALRVCGITDSTADIKRRIELLNRCVEQDAMNVKKVFGILGEYYEV